MQDSQLNALVLKVLRSRKEPMRVTSLLSRCTEMIQALEPGVDLLSSAPDRGFGLAIHAATFLGRLRKLQSLGLVIIDEETGSAAKSIDALVRIAPNFVEVQQALGFSLSETIRRNIKSMLVTPVFDQPTARRLDIFVIMPFDPLFDPTYRLIQKVCEAKKLRVMRGDDLFSAQQVVADIWSLLTSARLVICDCTGRNANVFYELGLAHAIGKTVFLLTQRSADIPFDLMHWRHLVYDLKDDGLFVALSAFLGERA